MKRSFHLLAAAALAMTTFPAWPWNGRVVAVPTGDTVTVSHGAKRVRLHLDGIEAPARRAAGWRDSRDSLAEVCLQRRAKITPTTNRDAQVACRMGSYWTDAALYQVDQGEARLAASEVRPNYVTAQNRAQAQCVGIWSGSVCAALAGGTFGSSGSSTGSSGGTITYRVYGSATEANITVETPDGTEQHTVSLPWSRTYHFADGDFVYLGASNQAATGTVSASIALNGNPVKTATSTAAYGGASVSCSRGRDC